MLRVNTKPLRKVRGQVILLQKKSLSMRVETTNVRLVYVKAVNNNGSAAEIKLMLANVEPDVEGLQAAIEKASAVTNNNYTEATWNTLQAKIAEAEELAAAEDPDANEVEIMKVELVAATMALRLSDAPIIVEDPASDAAIQALQAMVEKSQCAWF